MGNTKQFHEEYKKTINRIIKDLYQGTPYWGKGRYIYGVTSPINDNDDSEWSNFNFINTHYLGVKSVFWSIVLPKLKELVGGQLGNPTLTKSWKEDNTNMQILIGLWDNRKNLFTTDSQIANQIIDTINTTRGRGKQNESNTQLSLEALPFISDVVDISGGGNIEDFKGTDIEFKYNGEHMTGQIKSLISITEEEDAYKVKTYMDRKYTQDLLIFTRNDGSNVSSVVFRNPADKMTELETGTFLIPKDFLLFKSNYDTRTKKVTFTEGRLSEELRRFKKLI